MLALSKILYNQDIFFLLLLTSFFLVALIKGFYWKHAKLLFKGSFSQRFANQYLREENSFTERVNLITFLLMSLNFTLIIVKFKNIIDLQSIITVFFLVLLFYLVKITSIKFLGFLFKLRDLSNLAVFFSLLFDKTFGFLLFPILIASYFFLFNISFYLLLLTLCLLLGLSCLKLFWFWKIGTNSFGLSPFYIFLYLCFLEFFPVLLLAKRIFY